MTASVAGNAEESGLFPSSRRVLKRFHPSPFENVLMLEGNLTEINSLIYLFNHLCLTMSAFSFFPPSFLNNLCLPHVSASHGFEGAPVKLHPGSTGSYLPATFFNPFCVDLFSFMFIIHSLICFLFSLDLYES